MSVCVCVFVWVCGVSVWLCVGVSVWLWVGVLVGVHLGVFVRGRVCGGVRVRLSLCECVCVRALSSAQWKRGAGQESRDVEGRVCLVVCGCVCVAVGATLGGAFERQEPSGLRTFRGGYS